MVLNYYNEKKVIQQETSLSPYPPLGRVSIPEAAHTPRFGERVSYPASMKRRTLVVGRSPLLSRLSP